MKKLYLAYGSNLNKEQMKTRCPGAMVIGTAELRNYELLFKGSRSGSYLTIEKKRGGKVPVAVWEVSAENEKALDRYEGYPSFYYKKEFPININRFDGTKERRNAFIYIIHESRPIGIPAQGYINICREGYRNFGFNEKFLDAAIERSMK
ncbi:MAG: gamma-glutamylcyclotransferase [Oscillospiraceae bacterium]|nr:gamma-glutamylcyclotransferase [Oscillospiraceae bacterium]